LALGCAAAAQGVVLSPDKLIFGEQTVGAASITQTVTLANFSAAALNLASIVASGDFTQTNDCGSALAAGASCAILVSFLPSTTGARTGQLTVRDDAPGSPQIALLGGNGVAGAIPGVTLSPASLVFAAQQQGQSSAAQAVTLANSGGGQLTLSNIAVAGDFAEANDCGVSLAPGASCTIQVTFTPAASGARSGALTVADNAAASPQSVALAGTDLSGPPADLLFQPADNGTTVVTVAAGNTALFNLNASTLNNFVGTVLLTCDGAPVGATCKVTPAQFASGGLEPVSVVVTTTQALGIQFPRIGTGPVLLLLLPALGLLLGGARFRKLAPLALMLLLTGCSTGRLGPATPAGTYILTITATSAGAPVGSAQLTLVVQ